MPIPTSLGSTLLALAAFIPTTRSFQLCSTQLHYHFKQLQPSWVSEPLFSAPSEFVAETGSVHSHEPDSLILKQLLPALLSYKENYGHPNIPLGSKEGRSCETLRRLQIQQKLTPGDLGLLESLGFRWHSLEDIYRVADFDELLERLKMYAKQNDGDISPPKKYDADPELGAWVTGIRRTGKENVSAEHCDRLNEIGFEWVSKRKCGSGFMTQYRNILALIEADSGKSSDPLFWMKDHKNRKWAKAQQQAKTSLSAVRLHYMENLLGPDWATLDLSDESIL